jgi:hypothetical protein
MRKITYCLILFLFIYPLSLMADNGLNESVLKELDRVIEEKYSFHVHKEKEIDEIKARLHRSGNNEEKYELCGSLFYLYLHYQADSSLYYINEKMRLLPLLDKPELKNEIIINRAEVMGVMGMYNEALEQLRQINPQALELGPLNYYYRTFRAYYGWVADYTTNAEEKQKYLEKTDVYRDSILATARQGVDRDIVLAEKYMVAGKPDSSLVILNGLLKKNEPLLLDVTGKDGAARQVNIQGRLPENWHNGANGSLLKGAQPILGVTWDLSSVGRDVTVHPTPWAQIKQSLKWMGDTLAKVVAPGSSVGVEHLSGPVGIANQFYKMFSLEEGWKLALWFSVVLNVNLAILNILPLPVVDGGHVVMNTIELVFRRPLNVKVLEFVQFGFVFLLMGFFLFVTFKDVGDFFGKKPDKLPTPVFKAVTD